MLANYIMLYLHLLHAFGQMARLNFLRAPRIIKVYRMVRDVMKSPQGRQGEEADIKTYLKTLTSLAFPVSYAAMAVSKVH